MQHIPSGYKIYLQGKYSPKTVTAYHYEVQNFISHHPQAATYKQSEVLQYIGQLRASGKTPATINRILAAIKSWYKFLSLTGHRADNPVHYLVLKHQVNRDIQLQDLLDDEELESLLHREERYPLLTARNYIIISLLVYQALRIKEIDQLQLHDVNLDKRLIKIRKQLKTNGRNLYLKEQQLPYFKQYIQEDRVKLLKGSNSPYLLIGQRSSHMSGADVTKHIIRTYRNYIPEKTINPKTIRQSVITNFLQKGKDLRVVQVFAGHKYTDTTEKYKQNNVDELQLQIEKYHPLK